MEHYKFFQNRECEYFPCHRVKDDKEFNCLFCYCPLYALGDNCGGDFTYTQKGVKNCTGCIKPHTLNGYDHVQAHIQKIIEIGKKR
ncbi:MAG: metal-binding protein [Clostridia bacterium]|jgi:Zn-finger protein|nr:metal-binding protein [Clostridia bacterium]